MCSYLLHSIILTSLHKQNIFMSKYLSTQRAIDNIIYKFWHLPEPIINCLHVLKELDILLSF